MQHGTLELLCIPETASAAQVVHEIRSTSSHVTKPPAGVDFMTPYGTLMIERFEETPYMMSENQPTTRCLDRRDGEHRLITVDERWTPNTSSTTSHGCWTSALACHKAGRSRGVCWCKAASYSLERD